MSGGDAGKARCMTSLAHRGPDAQDEYASSAVFLRHFRLAILGEERLAHQPMASFDGSVVLVFNGEIYNFRELAAWMGQPELAKHGDTRVLAELLARHGVERLDLLNGMFALAAYFPRDDALYLVRDRFGIKPLHYVISSGGLYFASEIKCFAPVVPLELDPHRIEWYLAAGAYPSGTSTFYKGVRQVEGGTYLRWHKGQATTTRYYDLAASCRALLERNLNVEGYEELLADSIRLRLRSDVPISLHFSAGTDSTALLLKTKEVWGWDYPLTAFTIAFRERDYDEAGRASRSCRAVGVQHHKVYMEAAEVPGLAHELHRFQDEPYGGIPTIAYYKMNKAERERGYIVSIEGQGGDETFGGYLYHAYMAMYDLYVSGDRPSLLRQMLRRYGTDIRTVVRRAEALIAAGFKAHTDLTDLRPGKTEPAERHIDWLRSVQFYDILANKLPRTLRFNDRASMACGREIRFPLLDYRVLAYGLAFPHHLKYARGLEKSTLRQIVRRHFPGRFHTARKRSVVSPQTEWLRGPLRVWAASRMDVVRRSGAVDAAHLARAEAVLCNDPADNSFPLWQVINLSFFCESACPTPRQS
jgi:asparagine synthase (glutamine-hydrolysing)